MMQALTVEQLQQALIQASQVIIANEPLLTQIDSIIGDGDHGTGMRDGFSVLQETLKTTKYPDIFALMRDAGIALVKTMGGASGVIFGTMFIAGHEGVRDRTPNGCPGAGGIFPGRGRFHHQAGTHIPRG